MREMEFHNVRQWLDTCLLLCFDPHVRGEPTVVSYQSTTQLHCVLLPLICCASARLAGLSNFVLGFRHVSLETDVYQMFFATLARTRGQIEAPVVGFP